MKKLLKKWFNLYDLGEIEHAMQSASSAKDRDDYAWKVKLRLKEIRGIK